jgi:hypothetical protein
LEVKDILQINATIIAGAFIFLSLSIVLMEESEREQEERLNQTNQNQTIAQFVNERVLRSNSHAFVAFLISFPFAISSIIAVAAEVDKDNPKVNYKNVIRGSLWLMFIGFSTFLIVAMLVFFGLIKFFPD